MFDKFKLALDDGRNKLSSGNYSYVVRGLVWFQGESDAEDSTNTANYQTNLSNFLSAIRTYLNEPNLPVAICSIDDSLNQSNSSVIRTAQQNVANGDSNYHYVPTENYSRSDNVHLNTQGMLDAGEAIANALAGISFNVLDYSPLAWFDASNGTEMTVGSNNKISQWNDKSSSASHITQPSSSNQPTYSNNQVQLNGSQYLFNTSPFIYSNGSADIFIVASGSAQHDMRLLNEGRSTNNTPNYGFKTGVNADTNKMAVFLRDDTNINRANNNVNNQTAFDGTFKILHWRDTGTSFDGRINGGVSGTLAYTRSGPTTLDRFCVGGVLRASFAAGFTGFIKEIIVTPVNTSTDREKLEGYLAHKWGLASDLPSSHPYKTTAP
jgi:hypothetical protein